MQIKVKVSYLLFKFLYSDNNIDTRQNVNVKAIETIYANNPDEIINDSKLLVKTSKGKFNAKVRTILILNK